MYVYIHTLKHTHIYTLFTYTYNLFIHYSVEIISFISLKNRFIKSEKYITNNKENFHHRLDIFVKSHYSSIRD